MDMDYKFKKALLDLQQFYLEPLEEPPVITEEELFAELWREQDVAQTRVESSQGEPEGFLWNAIEIVGLLEQRHV